MKILLYTILFLLAVPQFTSAQWVRKADMPTARWGLSACTLNDKIYVIGGSQSTGAPGYGSSKMEVYDPVLNTWDTTKAPMSTPRVMFMTAVVNGRIYAIGGRILWETGGDLAKVEEYDPMTDSWTTKAPMPKPRTNSGVCVHNDKIYIIGGLTGGSAFIYTDDLQIYDPASDTWDTTKTGMTYKRDPIACALNNFVYSIGGTNGPPYAGLHTVEAYDLTSDTWEEKKSTVDGRKGASLEMLNGKIYAFGGEDIADPVNSVEVYNPNTDDWTLLSQTPIWYTMHASAIFQNKIYLIGGSVSGGRYEVYTPTPIIYSFDPEFAYATSFEISHQYFPLQGDTLIIQTIVDNPDFHSINVISYIKEIGFNFEDSLELFDDGLHHDGAPNDNYYGGFKWLADLNENFFEVKLNTIDFSSGTTHSYYPNKHFTTAGPATVEGFRVVRLTGAIGLADFQLKNNGSVKTLVNVLATLKTNESCVTSIYMNTRGFGDIAPGETKTISSAFAFYYGNCANSVTMELEIKSNDIIYWRDTFDVDILTDADNDKSNPPKKHFLSQNYPNPFNPSTKISYSIPRSSKVIIKIFDMLGNEVAQIVNETQSTGKYEVMWNAEEFPSGVYFCELQSGEFREVKKMILVK